MTNLWYSTMSTGIAEVDQQHAALDHLLDYLGKSDDSQHAVLLAKFLDHLKLHFSYEEELVLAGTPFVNDAHRAVHRELEVAVGDILKTVEKDRRVDIQSIVNELGLTILSHVTNYDAPMKSVD